MDLLTRGQYTSFHGKEPPREWREATPVDIRRAAGNERPNIVFISSPCKGASGFLSETLSKTAKYQALNELTLRCVWLMAEAWADDPVDLIVFENVPRLATRSRHLLDQIVQLLQSFGYAVAETNHDCGELGGLAQSRKRFCWSPGTRQKCRRSCTSQKRRGCARWGIFWGACLSLATSRAAQCTVSVTGN